MRFRARTSIALFTAALPALLLFAWGARREMRARLLAQYEARADALVGDLEWTLEREREAVHSRLAELASVLVADNRFRRGALDGASADRPYVVDYGESAMRLAGLATLQIQDAGGTVVSSGHFRTEYGRRDSLLVPQLEEIGETGALVSFRTADAQRIAFASVERFVLGTARFTIVGGTSADSLVARASRGPDLSVRLEPDGAPETDGTAPDVVTRSLAVPMIGPGPARERRTARFVVDHSLAPLRALERRIDIWLGGAVGLTVVVVTVLSIWLAGRVTRPLTALAGAAARIDLTRQPEVRFPSGGRDEVGTLSTVLAAMTERLRVSAEKLRKAERRSAVGDLARQVNHDIKNGLVPIRNVVRHLTELAENAPSDLPKVFEERRATLESSIAYLEDLSSRYAKLSPRTARRPCDVHEVVDDVVSQFRDTKRVTVRVDRRTRSAAVLADAVVLRRILENLVRNGVESFNGQPGTVTITTECCGEREPAVRIVVADTGPGMSKADLERAFEDFYTTKQQGTGLGLSVVRRLVLDLDGSLTVRTEPGAGTAFTVVLPAARESELQAAASDANAGSRGTAK